MKISRSCYKTDEYSHQRDFPIHVQLSCRIYYAIISRNYGIYFLVNLILQLQDLICQILQGHLVMFRKDSFLTILSKYTQRFKKSTVFHCKYFLRKLILKTFDHFYTCVCTLNFAKA